MSLKIILAVVVLAIAGVLGYASTKPDTFRYESSIVINAAPAKIHAILNDLHTGDEWSAWNKIDPAMKKTYGGPASGKGQTFEWDGNKDVGAGKIEIVETTPNKITMSLDFIRPMEGRNMVDYDLEPVEGGTKVTSAMYGPQPFFAKLIGVFIDCEKMISEKTQESLASLKAMAEKQ